jgi:hypothetical protein
MARTDEAGGEIADAGWSGARDLHGGHRLYDYSAVGID